MRFAGTTITTVHDLSVLRFPEWHPADRVKWYEAGFRRGLKQTDHFIAVSQFTRHEMIELLGIAPERITTIHQGPREIFTPAAGEEYQPQLRQLDVTPPFFLFVGTLEPRKNLSTVLRAYRALPRASSIASFGASCQALPSISKPASRIIRYVSSAASPRVVRYPSTNSEFAT